MQRVKRHRHDACMLPLAPTVSTSAVVAHEHHVAGRALPGSMLTQSAALPRAPLCPPHLHSGTAPKHRPQRSRDLSMVCGALTASAYDDLTKKLVAASSIPFTIIVLPQVLQNAQNLQAGNLAALGSISWVGWTAGLSGNALMSTHLAARGEATAVNVQLIGVVSNLMVLAQLWMAGVMPTAAFSGVLTAALLISVLGALRSRGKLSQQAWLPLQVLVSAAAVLAVPQVLWSSFAPATASPWPSLVAAAGVLGWLRRVGAQSDTALAKVVAALPGWCATAMFTLSPVPQLVRNFSDLSALEGLSLGTMLLALAGNAACIPRALYTRDGAWSFGTTWGCLMMGWAQLLSLYLGVNPATGMRFLPGPAFAAISAALGAYLVWVQVTDAHAKGLPHPFSSYPDVFFGGSGGTKAQTA